MEALSFQKERIQNMAIYFVKNTDRVGMVKLMKLFYFCDRECYLKTGFKITDLEYTAKEKGPVLMDIYNELKRREKIDKYGIINVIQRERANSQKTEMDELYFKPKRNKDFCWKFFSRCELGILQDICNQYKLKTGAQMSMESHEDGLPWLQTWNNGQGDGQLIDFDLDIERYLNSDKLDRIRYVQNIAKNFKENMAAL